MTSIHRPMCTATIKFSREEVELMANVFETYIKMNEILSGSSSTDIPFVSKLLDDLKDIKKQMLDKENDAVLNRDDTEQSVHSER